MQPKFHLKTEDMAALAIGLSVLCLVITWGIELLAHQIFFIN